MSLVILLADAGETILKVVGTFGTPKDAHDFVEAYQLAVPAVQGIVVEADKPYQGV